MGEKAQGLGQNKQGEVKNSIGSGEAKELLYFTSPALAGVAWLNEASHYKP